MTTALVPTALVLCGGLGTRLREALPDLPKVLAPVAGRPFAAHVLDRLVDAGVRRVVLCTGYRGEAVRVALGDAHRGVPLAYSHEDAPLGTGGALRLAAQALLAPRERALAVNGDSLPSEGYRRFAEAATSRGEALAMMIVRVGAADRFGSVERDTGGRVTRFVEKDASRPGPGWVNAGAYLVGREDLLAVPEGRAVSLERETLPAWVTRGLWAYEASGDLLDIGTPESLAAAEGWLGRA